MPDGRLSGKVAIVTGASAGIGEAIAIALAGEGASVVLAARRLDRIKATAATIEESGGEALAVQTDVARQEDVEALA
jgi:NADP-dependent 3-hydroxy acid dehydrogenase YdfG